MSLILIVDQVATPHALGPIDHLGDGVRGCLDLSVR